MRVFGQAIRPCIRVFCATVLIGLSACSTPEDIRLPAASPDLFDPAVSVEMTARDHVLARHGEIVSGAAEGAGIGAAAGVVGALSSGGGDPYAGLLAIGLAPVFGIGGAIYGASAAHPTEEVEAAIAAMRRVYDDETLRGGVAEGVTRQLTSLGLTVVPACVDPAAGEADTGAGCEDARTGHLKLGIAYGFLTRGEFSLDLYVWISVHASASMDGSAGSVERFHWAYRSDGMDFFEATANHAAVLRARVVDAQAMLVRQIVDDLVRHPSPRMVRVVPGMGDAARILVAYKPGSVRRLPAQTTLLMP